MSTWRITWGDRSWSESDVTVGHVAAIVMINGVDEWEQLNPLAGPSKLISMLAVLIAGDDGRPIEDVLKELGSAPAVRLLNALSVQESEAETTPPPSPRKRSRPPK